MNKNVLAVFAAVCGLFMVSCDTPSDLRPEEKVSVDFVEPGTRNTHNLSTTNPPMHEEQKGEVLLNHDPIGPNEAEANQANKADSVDQPGNITTGKDSLKN